MSRKTGASLLLLLAAFVWGSATVAQSTGMDYVQPFTYITMRNLLAFLTLLPVIFLRRRKQKQKERIYLQGLTRNETRALAGYFQKRNRRETLLGGLCCGAVLTAAGGFQQVGITMTTAGKTGFITSLYIVMVPLFGMFLGKKIQKRVWLCVVMAVFGFYLLCAKEGMSISQGDGLVLICAVCYSVHILVIDHFVVKDVDAVVMAGLQFLVVAILSAVLMLVFEQPSVRAIWEARYPVLYAGVLSSGLGFTLQIVAQREVDPTRATLIMSLESVFSVLSGWLVLHETLTGRELLGCVVVFAAIMLVQLPARHKLTKKGKEKKQEGRLL